MAELHDAKTYITYESVLFGIVIWVCVVMEAIKSCSAYADHVRN